MRENHRLEGRLNIFQKYGVIRNSLYFFAFLCILCFCIFERGGEGEGGREREGASKSFRTKHDIFFVSSVRGTILIGTK